MVYSGSELILLSKFVFDWLGWLFLFGGSGGGLCDLDREEDGAKEEPSKNVEKEKKDAIT